MRMTTGKVISAVVLGQLIVDGIRIVVGLLAGVVS